MPASDGLLYTAFPSSEDGATRKTAVPQLKLHRLGTPVSDDVLIYENPTSPCYFFPSVTEDRIVLTFLYEPGSSIAWAPIDGPYDFRGSSAATTSSGSSGTAGDTFYVATTNDAPYGRVVAVDAVRRGTRVTVVPETRRAAADGRAVGARRRAPVRRARARSDAASLTMYARGRIVVLRDRAARTCAGSCTADVAEPVSASPDGRHDLVRA